LSITEIPHTTERTYQWKDDHYFFSGCVPVLTLGEKPTCILTHLL
jgi:hypothetical protein